METLLYVSALWLTLGMSLSFLAHHRAPESLNRWYMWPLAIVLLPPLLAWVAACYPFTRRRSVPHPLNDLARDQKKWSQKTFGARDPKASILHLRRECDEMLTAYDSDLASYATELADGLILLLDAAWRAGITENQLVSHAMAKMEVNKAREWPPAVGDEPTEHVR